MYESIHFDNYRCFNNFTLNGLTYVNLLVGKNNAGKSAALEGIYLLERGLSFEAVRSVLRARGEYSRVSTDDEDPSDSEVELSFAHLFPGHRIQLGVNLEIHGREKNESFRKVTAEISTVTEDVLEDALKADSIRVRKRGRQLDLFEAPVIDRDLVTIILGSSNSTTGSQVASSLIINGDGLSVLGEREEYYRRSSSRASRGIDSLRRLRFVPTRTPTTSQLIGLWSEVLSDGHETQVSDALKLIDETIENVVFLPGRPYRLSSPNIEGILVKRRNEERAPLGSLGEGVLRLLSLAIHLDRSAGGVLLIDEIDTGLHWSVLQPMWKLVVQTAIRTGTQVFATTHSLDCLRALAECASEYNELADHVSVHRINSADRTSTDYSAGMIQAAVDNEVEMR